MGDLLTPPPEVIFSFRVDDDVTNNCGIFEVFFTAKVAPDSRLNHRWHKGNHGLLLRRWTLIAQAPAFLSVVLTIKKSCFHHAVSDVWLRSSIIRTMTDTKKPAGLVPCGLSGLQRTILVSPRKNFGGAGGSWTRVRNYYAVGTTCLVQSLHSPASCGWTRH